MKRNSIKWMFTALLGLVMGMAFVSCSDDDSPSTSPEPTKQAKYTIMLYGCGGGNVDAFFESSIVGIVDALKASNNQVRFTVMFSMSKDDSQYKKAKEATDFLGEWGTTYRYELTPNTDFSKAGYRSKYKYKDAKDVKLYDVATIVDYINWAKKTAPADNYILMPINHGGGFDLDQEAITRAICYDDNFDGSGVATKAFAQALSQTGKIKAIYWAGCLMGQLEVLSELAPYCDYQFCSSHVSRAIPCLTYQIIRAINQSPNDFEAAAKIEGEMKYQKDPTYGYVYTQCFSHVEDAKEKGVYHDENCDFGCWRSDKIAAVNEQVKLMGELMTASYGDATKQEAVDLATHSVYGYEFDNYFVDALDYAVRLATLLDGGNNATAKQIAANLEQALEAANVYRVNGIQRKTKDGALVQPQLKKFTLGISVYSHGNSNWTKYKKNYTDSAFDRATSWSKFLDINAVDVYRSDTNPCNDSSWEAAYMDDLWN